MADVTAAGSECWLIPHGLSPAATRKSDPAITAADGAGLGWRHSLATGPPLQGPRILRGPVAESSAPLRDLGDQRPEAVLLGERGPESTAGCDVDPLLLGELRQVRSSFPTSVSPSARSLQTPLSAALEKGTRSQYPKCKQELIRVKVA